MISAPWIWIVEVELWGFLALRWWTHVSHFSFATLRDNDNDEDGDGDDEINYCDNNFCRGANAQLATLLINFFSRFSLDTLTDVDDSGDVIDFCDYDDDDNNDNVADFISKCLLPHLLFWQYYISSHKNLKMCNVFTTSVFDF